MTTVKERLLQYLMFKGLSHKEFETKAKISNGYVNNIVNTIGPKTLPKILEAFPDLNKNWLIFNEGKMTLPENDNNKSYQQQRLQRKIDGSKDDNTAPLVPVKAQAGYSRAYDQSEYIDALEKYALPPNITKHGAIWRYWEIEGDSMLPTFKNKDIILTSQVHEMDWDQLRNFYCYVVVTDEHVFFKRIAIDRGRWIAISDNEDNGYEQFEIDASKVKELWVFRRHIDSSAPVPKEFKINI